jgi:hypothetical protein
MLTTEYEVLRMESQLPTVMEEYAAAAFLSFHRKKLLKLKI